MKICPVCSTEFPPGTSHCPDDGVALVSMNTAATGRPEELIGQIVEGRYRIERIVGKGGMGTVYACRHVVVGKIAAMKVLRPGADSSEGVLQRFIREAQTTNLLKSRHIVEIADFGQLPNGLLFVVMELLEGEDLTKAMKPGRSTRAELIHIFTQVAETLALAHDKGIVHRDLKPDNVFLVQDGDDKRFVKLLDFGIAKVLHGESNAGLTETGVILGTPYYMSPEQARADLVDHRSDIYSLGVMMYRAFAGRLPFVADSTMGVLTRHITEAPELPSRLGNVDPLTERMILRCMEKSPQNRFQSMLEVAAALRALPLVIGTQPVRDEPTVNDRPAAAGYAPSGYTGAHGAAAPSGAYQAAMPSGAYPQAGASGAYQPSGAYQAAAPSGHYAPVSAPSGQYAPASGSYALPPAPPPYMAPNDPRRSAQGLPAAPQDFRASGAPVSASLPMVDPGMAARSSSPSGGHATPDPGLVGEVSMTSLRWPPGTTARGFAATHQPPPSQGRGMAMVVAAAALMVAIGALAAFFVFFGRGQGPAPAGTSSAVTSAAITTPVASSAPAAAVSAAPPAPPTSDVALAVPSSVPSAEPVASASAGKVRPLGPGVVPVKTAPTATGPRKPPTEIRSPFE